VGAPEGCGVAAAFLRGLGCVGEGCDKGPDKGFEVEAIDAIVDCTPKVSTTLKRKRFGQGEGIGRVPSSM